MVAGSLAQGVFVLAQEQKAPDAQQPKPTKVQEPKGPNLSAEQIAEGVIIIYGNGFGRAGLNQIRRNGVERGRSTQLQPDGRTEEGRYELRFVRGENASKDKVRVDRKTAQADYSLVYGGGNVFGIINGSAFTPRAEAAADFIAERVHSIDALLRYKENDSKVSLVRKDKSQGVDIYILDLTDKEKRATRYIISAKSLRVLWLEYEETPPGSPSAISYLKRFYDYRVAQSTLVPFRTTLREDGKQTLETRILTITYGVKLEDSVFQNPDQTSASNP
jgi:hypothetical protein